MDLATFMERAAEDHAIWLQQIENSTAPRQCTCCMCGDVYSEDDPRWYMPHLAAGQLTTDEAYVCGPLCEKEWREEHWDLIEEYEQKEDVK